MAVYAEAEDLINVGAYHSGSNPGIDAAIEKHMAIEEFLVQEVEERSPLEDTLKGLGDITGEPIPQEDRPVKPGAFSGSAREMIRETV
jgi:flagellum-specific ATP synthase